MLQSMGSQRELDKTERLNSAELSVDPLFSQFDLQKISVSILRDLINLLPKLIA